MTGFRLFLVLLSIGWLVSVTACQDQAELPETAITLRVTSDSELDRLEFRFQAFNAEEQLVDFPLAVDLRNEEFVFSIRPGEVFQDEVFIWVKGYKADVLIAQASRLTAFVSGEIVEEVFELRAAFIDADGDGFSPCSLGPSCDCDDTQPSINPLATEVCGDVVDNNCNGAAEEDCPCTSDQICTVVPDTFVDVSAGIGRCQFGIRRCTDGVLSETCEGALGIGEEEILGNYIDDDCDGSVDEGGTCDSGSSRGCLLGFVDDEQNPDPAMRRAASERALGICQLGTQLCAPNGTWQSCQGETRPQRHPDTGIFIELTTQCDGLDNDCDGEPDDEPYFDADSDGYTRCGTCRNEGGEILCPESIDCNDSDALISPAAIELCGNDVDEDCRCDHDDSDRPVGPASAIGLPSFQLDGTRSCLLENTALSCSRLPRSDPKPTGFCSELDAPYFAGYVEDSQGRLGACMSCGLVFGLQCFEDGGCSDPEYDCRACNVADEVYAPRPYCTAPDALTCRNDIEPIFNPIFGVDPYGDCDQVSCEGYYFGIDGNECYRRADIPADAVLCQGAEQCETASELCPNAGRHVTAEPSPLCTYVSSGCEGNEVPVFANQDAGNDIFGTCNDTYACSEASEDGGPYYHGIFTEGGLAYCFYKATVANSACNGFGACQSKTEACLASVRGDPVSSRPQCEAPISGCLENNGPVYGPVERFQDPYNDCGDDEGCCVDALGAGVCCQDLGQTCSVDSECASGLSCVEGVCCDGACNSPCQSCLASLNTSNQDGICSALADRGADLAPVLLCGESVGECGGDLGCECVAETGDCRRELGALCGASNECSTLACECIDGGCSESRCTLESCAACRFDADQDGECEGFVSDDSDDFAGTCGALGCNGLGACNIENTSVCSVNQECLSNICRQGICGPQAGIGETCDEDADCLSPARCEVGLLCGIPGLVSTQTSLVTVVEGGVSATVGVGLASQPSSETILDIRASNLEFLVSPLSLVFGPTDWQNTKTVTITAVNDVIDDGDIDGELQISVFSTQDTGYNSVDPLVVPLRSTDNDDAAFVVSPATGALQLNEGESGEGSVALGTEPLADVTVSLSVSDATEVAVTGSLTFTPANWNIPQTFFVEALTDSTQDSDQSVDISIEVSASSDLVYSALQPSIVTVSVIDIDQAGLTLTDIDGLTVDESGGSAQFNVMLSSVPSKNVTVPLSLDPGGQASLAASALTFTKNNWDVPQTVTVTGLDDFIDDGTVSFYVILGSTISSDNNFDNLTRQVLVSALDDDESGFNRGDPSATSLSESGGSVTYTLTLSSQPIHNVEVPIVSQDAGLSVSPANLVLNSSNWNTGATLTLTGQDDDIAQGNRDVSIVWGPALSNDVNYDGLTLLSTSLTLLDDDEASIVVGDDNLGVGENGSSVLAKLKLGSQPTNSVELAFSGGVGEVSFSPSTLTFDGSNWDQDQYLTITGVDDDIDDGTQTETITVSSTSLDSGYQGLSTTFTVQNADNDFANVSVTPPIATTISEESGTLDFSVTLDTRPLHDVTVVFSADSGRGSLSNQIQVFTPAQWSEVRTVTFDSNDDDINNGNITVTVSAAVTSLDPLYDGISVSEQEFTIIDDDVAELVFGSTTGFSVSEGSADQASTTVKLSSEPLDDVTLSFSVDGTEVSMISAPLTFTALNWNQNQSIIFTSADDDIDDGDQVTSVDVVSSSSDGDYNGLSQSLSCTTVDDDTAGISVSLSGTSVIEGGSSQTMTVTLDSEPVAEVVVTTSSNSVDLTLSKASLTFNSANWDTPQSLTIEATDDAIYEAAETGRVTLSASTSSDGLYSGLASQTFDFAITDNESEPVVSVADISLVETDGNVSVSVSVSVNPVSYQSITIGYTTQNDTALAGQDYQAAAGNVVIDAGDSSATIGLTVLGDNLVEGDEDFMLSLSSLSLGSFALGGDSARLTITDDDASALITNLTSSESSLSATLLSSTTLVCSFTDADYTSASDYLLSLSMRGPDNATEYVLCTATPTSGVCLGGGSPTLTEPSPGQYQMSYVWDPLVGLPDGDYDIECSISDGSNTTQSDFADYPDVITLDSTAATVTEVREASGGGGRYEEDDDLIIEIEFSEVVSIANGTNLELELDVSDDAGTQSATATYFAGSGSTVLRFIYTVEGSGWADSSDLGYPSQGSLSLGGGTTLSDNVGNPVNLTLPVPGSPTSLSGTSDIELN